ncbi:MAG: DUF928 domain-containing protein [Leptolyngbyaceae bacterium]|nr:DUF928 domain-containing protein [Leptolyngbyaceae bacterium]
MNGSQLVRAFGKLTIALVPGCLILAGWFVPMGAQPDPAWKVSLQFPPAPNRGAPASTAGGGKRGVSCIPKNQLPLTSLVPINQVGVTTALNPTLFWYVPRTTAKTAELLVVDDQANELYRQEFNLPGGAGILKLNLPETVGLKAEKTYNWRFSLVCDPEDRGGNESVKGAFQYVPLSADLQRSLANTKEPLKQAELYAQARIWHETLAVVAELRDEQPQQWEELLRSVGLRAIAKEPFLDCCTVQKSLKP